MYCLVLQFLAAIAALWVTMSVSLSICWSVGRSVSRSVGLSVYQSVCQSVWTCVQWSINSWTYLLRIYSFVHLGPHPFYLPERWEKIQQHSCQPYRKKSQISFPERPTSLIYSYKQDTHTDIALYIYRFMYRYTVLLYTTCTDELYFCVHNSYKRDTHTHTDITLYIYRFLYRYTVLLYTSCTDGLYFCVHCCTTWHYLNIHLWCTHYAWISCTAVRLYCSPVSVRLYCQLVLTNESPTKIIFMNRVDQSQLRFLGIAPPPPPPFS